MIRTWCLAIVFSFAVWNAGVEELYLPRPGDFFVPSRRVSDFKTAYRENPVRETPAVPPEHQILLRSRRIVTPDTPSLLEFPTANRPDRDGAVPVMVQFREVPDEEARQTVIRCGARITGYLPHRTLVVAATPETCRRLAANPQIRALEEFLPSDKIQPLLAAMAAEFDDEVPVLVRRVTADGEEPVWRGTVRLSELGKIAADSEVRWIQYWERPRLLTDLAHNPGHLNTKQVWNDLGLTGSGQLIGHSDTGIDTGSTATLMADFSGRVSRIERMYYASTGADTDGHGTHTAGLIVGNGTLSSGKYRGVAYGASLIHHAFHADEEGYIYGIPEDVREMFQKDYRYGARLHSASWGVSTEFGEYDISSRQVDNYCWSYPKFLPVFAAGNSGADTAPGNGVIDDNSIMTPATAKNCITVGAAESDRPHGTGGYSSYRWSIFSYTKQPLSYDYISESKDGVHQGLAAFSSRGPTLDGRIKPDVVAPGTDIISTRSTKASDTLWGKVNDNTNYLFCGGTSMATPLAAGAAALLREYAINKTGIRSPSAALIKAMMLGGARSLTPGQYGTDSQREIPEISPNNAEGWGQVDLGGTLCPSNRTVYLADMISVDPAKTNTYTVTVAEPGTPITAVLAWMDYPSEESAAKALVNDYDLQMVTPVGNVVYPNGLDAPDTLNTAERIMLETEEPGIYQVRIIAREVAYSSKSGGAVSLYLSIPSAAAAAKSENLTTNHAVPLSWLAANGYSGDLESAVFADDDGDGLAVWEEYYAGTNPRDAESALRFISYRDRTLVWIGGTNRTQRLQYSGHLTGTWETVQTFLPPTAITNRYPAQEDQTNGFYRLSVPVP